MSLIAIISALECKQLPPKSECAHHAANLAALYDRVMREDRLAVDGLTLAEAIHQIDRLLVLYEGPSEVKTTAQAFVDAYRGWK